MDYSLTWFVKPKRYISKKLQFIIIGKEHTKKGKVHYQGYCQLKHKLSFKQLKRLFGRTVHIERCKKSSIHNIAYCCKEGELFHIHGNPRTERAQRLLAHFSSSQKVKANSPNKNIKDAENTQRKEKDSSSRPKEPRHQEEATSIQENKL